MNKRVPGAASSIPRPYLSGGDLRDSEKRPQPGGRLGPVEPVRDVPNGRERHGHTILGHANRSPAPAACFANRPALLTRREAVHDQTRRNDGGVPGRTHLALEFTFVHSGWNEIPACA